MGRRPARRPRSRRRPQRRHHEFAHQLDQEHGPTDGAPELPASSMFESLEAASAFYQAGSLGYSATPDASRFQGLELRCRNWSVEPLAIEEVRSSFFDNESHFPKGSIEFDCALLMRGIDHEWIGHSDLCCPNVGPKSPSSLRVKEAE